MRTKITSGRLITGRFLVILMLVFAVSIPAATAQQPISGRIYEPRGIGGGGAMSGFSISPYSNLWFVGTDMGTLFRSHDAGDTWQPVSHDETTFHSSLDHAAYLGFAKDDRAIFHAPKGKDPIRSLDKGVTWESINIPLAAEEHIKYWLGNSDDENHLLCATSTGLFRTTDMGNSWQRCGNITGLSRGTVFDYTQTPAVIYHATADAIYKSDNGGESFTEYYRPAVPPIRGFSGGRDGNGLTLTFIDSDGENACSAWVLANPNMTDPADRAAMYDNSGYVWVKRAGESSFQATSQYGGAYVRMAENNASIIYVTGDRAWPRGYGTKVWVSSNAGQSWTLRFHQYNWDVVPYEPWPADKLDYSAVGLDVGWWDDGYESFAINRRNASVAGGTGWFFLHTTKDVGDHWLSPFTQFADSAPREAGKRWRSVGLEMTSCYDLKFHPANPQITYAGFADIHGLVSEDGGRTFRITKAGNLNSFYDFAFDPANDQVAYAAVNSMHDWPKMWYSQVLEAGGGIFRTQNRGRSWTRLTDQSYSFGMLSVAYDATRHIIYGGSHRVGVVRSTDGGATWSYFNDGLPAGQLPANSSLPGVPGRIVPQLEIDPSNGNVYLLLTGDEVGGTITNRMQTGIYFLDVAHGATTWVLLRGTVHHPDGVGNYQMWWYPTAFAIDFTDPNTLWLADMEKQGSWLATGIWKTTDRGQNWHRKLQFTHPTGITLDPLDHNKIHIGGGWSREWGQGGPYYSVDGGQTWEKNSYLPEQNNLYSVTFDPNHLTRVFYNYFGGGLFYGPKPDAIVSDGAPLAPARFMLKK